VTDPDNTVMYTPVEHNEGLLIGLSDEALDALEDTDEVRQERARRRQELAATPADLLKFFTRREADYWPRRDRTKYIPHTGAQELLRRETGMSRAEAKEAVRRFHKERADAQLLDDSRSGQPPYHDRGDADANHCDDQGAAGVREADAGAARG
jgi:hypothetical protein